jgi:hypothetical protein
MLKGLCVSRMLLVVFLLGGFGIAEKRGTLRIAKRNSLDRLAIPRINTN